MADPYVGEIMIFAGNYAPSGWQFCNGQLLNLQTYMALFAVIGTTYGGDGKSNFALPDLRGRVPVHFGNGVGLSQYTIGQKEGSETVTLTQLQMPIHTHAFSASGLTATLQAGNSFGTSATAAGNYICNAGDPSGSQSSIGVNYAPAAQAGNLTSVAGLAVSMGAAAIASTGGSQSHSNIQPFLALNFIIATQGIYPNRE